MGEKKITDTVLFTSMVAAKQGWTLNPDTELVMMLEEGLTVNNNRYGYFLCPCRDTEGTREADAAVICPCKYARGDIERSGHCFCALYLRKDFAEGGGVPSSIPDGRFGK